MLRVLPNLPCVVQEGAIVMARGRHVGSSETKLLQHLLEACGRCEEVPEAYVDIHTGLSGSGVAFVSIASSIPSPTLGKEGAHPSPSDSLCPQSPTLRPAWLLPRPTGSSACPQDFTALGIFEASPFADPWAQALVLAIHGYCSGHCS